MILKRIWSKHIFVHPNVDVKKEKEIRAIRRNTQRHLPNLLQLLLFHQHYPEVVKSAQIFVFIQNLFSRISINNSLASNKNEDQEINIEKEK